MPVTQAICNQAKGDFLLGTHQPTDTFKVALYTQAAATLNADTTAYTATGEVSGTGYTAGGTNLTGQYTVTIDQAGDFAYLNFPNNPTWPNSSLTADAALIYNASKQNKAVAVLTFASVTTIAGTLVVNILTDANNQPIKLIKFQ